MRLNGLPCFLILNFETGRKCDFQSTKHLAYWIADMKMLILSVSHADAARCVLQLFDNMGRIFQEQSAADTIQAGLHIDKKRRRMLQEKRMALGHKADDHEELRMN